MIITGIFSLFIGLIFILDHSRCKGATIYDLVVVGLGSGGLAAARRAGKYGAKVAVIERSLIGGTCVNAGCVPKKVIWTAASLVQAKRLYSGYGIFDSLLSAKKYHNDGVKESFWFEMEVNREARNSYISRIHRSYAGLFSNFSNIDLFLGFDVTEIDVSSPLKNVIARRANDGVSIKVNGKRILLATGGHPKLPEYPLSLSGITSDDFWTLPSIPESVVISGGGYIAVELASILKSLGSKRVTMVVRSDRLLIPFDHDIVNALHKELVEREGVEILYMHSVTEIKNLTTDDGLDSASRIVVSSVTSPMEKREIDADLMVWAIGRSPNTGINGLPEKIIDPQSRLVIVNEATFETAIPGLYAIGDIIRGHHLTPIAIAEGRSLVDQIFRNGPPFDGRTPIPTSIFSVPPVASVGDSENEAKKKYGDENVYSYLKTFIPMMISAISAPGDEIRKRTATYKLVCIGQERRVVGIHIFGPCAEEIIQGFAVAMTTGHLTKDIMDATIALHPTMAEELLLM